MIVYRCKKTDKGDRVSKSPDLKALWHRTEDRDKGILCRVCSHLITSPEEMVEKADRHVYTFKNPAGIVYTIGCFQNAPGCLSLGTSTNEFTWFPGFLWNFAVCRRCFSHLGWFYQSPSGDSFYGLILNQLINRSSYH